MEQEQKYLNQKLQISFTLYPEDLMKTHETKRFTTRIELVFVSLQQTS